MFLCKQINQVGRLTVNSCSLCSQLFNCYHKMRFLETNIEDDFDFFKENVIDNRILSNADSNKFRNEHIYLIFLNSNIKNICTENLIKQAHVRIGIDGGANRFYNYSQENKQFLDEKYKLDTIIGDLDSVKQSTIEFYKKLDTKILYVDNQDNNDFEKGLDYIIHDIKKDYDKNKTYRLMALGGLGGRYDQIFVNLSSLLKFSVEAKNSNIDNCHLSLVDEQAICTFIMPGKSKYIIDKSIEKQKNIGIIPFSTQGSPLIHTEGLKWNLNYNLSKDFKFGNFISSSNEIINDSFKIATNIPLLIATNLLTK